MTSIYSYSGLPFNFGISLRGRRALEGEGKREFLAREKREGGGGGGEEGGKRPQGGHCFSRDKHLTGEL